MPIHNQTQLITYPDSLGANLPALADLLEGPFAGLFGGVHILPPFPSSGDRGFSPLTYFEIDPRFGSWDDIRRIGARHDVMLDLMVNHISRQSVYFQDFLQKGRASPYADLFITLGKIWPAGSPPPEDVAKIFLRRPETPFLDVTIAATGQVERVWATFGGRDWAEQIDLDVTSPHTRRLLSDILAHMSREKVAGIRLDAVAYVNKKPGTSCFFVEPDLFEFMDWMTREAAQKGIELLPEVHAECHLQDRLAEHGYWVYNFVLPFLVLQALLTQTSRALVAHLKVCPRRQFTNLDTHDGIPVQPDVNGLVDIDAAQRVVQMCLERGANLNRIFSVHHRLRPDFDAHQINITYYEALGKNDDRYLAARAIQLFAPGIPQVYYVGLLAGENDGEAVKKAGDGRAINRHNFSLPEVEQSLHKEVVRRLFELIRFRNAHPAFKGTFRVLEATDRQVRLEWSQGEAFARLTVDLDAGKASIAHNAGDNKTVDYIP